MLFIAFDDVDTDFVKGWPVMETIRRYLTSPQLIIILSGDLDLYSLLIRKKQWKNFGKTLLKNEYDKDFFNNEDYIGMVYRLESQYLIKVLKPENRVVLSPLLKKIDLGVKTFVIEAKSGTVTVKDYYVQFLENLGIASYIGIETYYPHLASMPIRTQISLIKSFEKYKEDQSVEGLIQNITDVFYTDLKSSKVEVWDLINGIGFINVHLLRFLTENKILDEGSQLLPKTENDTINGALIALGFVWHNKIINQPAEIFDYIIRISNVVNLTDKWGYENEYGTNVNDFITHSKVYHDYGLKKIASLQSSYIDTFLTQENLNDASTFGFIPIKTLYRINKKREKLDTFRLDDIFKFDRKQSILDYLGYLPAFSVTGSLDRNRIYYSFNNILAAVGELMLVDKEHILDEFIKLSQFREFPRWQKGISLAIRGKKNVGEEDNSLPIDINESGLGEEISGLKSFIKSFKDWKISHQKIEIPPYLLGRIMVRTYYSFLRIDADTDALQLHRQFICFFNAVAIEEYMERESAAGINLANPTGSDKIFIDNVDFIVKQAINLPLFNMIIKCPLINVYADLSILMNTTGYNTLFDENINVNIKLRKLNTIINTQEQSSSDNTFPHIVILDNVSTERVSHNFWETPDNAKKIARYAMDNNLRKVDIINNNKLTKQIVKQLFGNKKLYDKRIVNLQKILSNTNYSLKEIEWI